MGKRLSVFEKPLFVPDQVHQVGGILAVVDREGGIETDLVGIFAQQPRADAVEGAGPGQRVGHDAGIVADHLAGDPLDPLRHLGSRAARKRHQQDAPRIGAVDDQMGHAMGQRVGLAGARAGDHQQRRERPLARRAMLDGPPLLRIEAFEVGGCRWHGMVVPGGWRITFRDSRPAHNDSGTRLRWRFGAAGPGLREAGARPQAQRDRFGVIMPGSLPPML